MYSHIAAVAESFTTLSAFMVAEYVTELQKVQTHILSAHLSYSANIQMTLMVLQLGDRAMRMSTYAHTVIVLYRVPHIKPSVMTGYFLQLWHTRTHAHTHTHTNTNEVAGSQLILWSSLVCLLVLCWAGKVQLSKVTELLTLRNRDEKGFHWPDCKCSQISVSSSRITVTPMCWNKALGWMLPQSSESRLVCEHNSSLLPDCT